MTDVEVPQGVLDLLTEQRDTDFAVGLVKQYEPKVMMALNYDQITNPRGGPLSLPSFLASVQLDVASNPRLGQAIRKAPASFLKCLMLAAQCKLLVGNSYSLFYLIPRYNKKLGVEEVTPMIGYKGLCDMMQRHPRVHKVEAHLIYEGEEFSYNPGTGKLHHEVNILGDRSDEKCIGGYARVVITDPSGHHPVLDDPVVMIKSRAEIDKIMRRSDAWQNAERPPKWGGEPMRNSPWHTDWQAMAKKTCLRAVANNGSVPRDMGIGAIIAQEDHTDIYEPRPLPKSTQKATIRQQLGIDGAPSEFALAEEAIAAIQGATTVAQLEAMAAGWQHFQGMDTQMIADAYEAKLEEIASRE